MEWQQYYLKVCTEKINGLSEEETSDDLLNNEIESMAPIF